MRVKLCWRRGREGKAETYSATQLMANVKKGAWEESLKAYAEKQQGEGIAHFLIPQRDGNRIVHAALIEIGSLVGIWMGQREESERLISEGARASARRTMRRTAEARPYGFKMTLLQRFPKTSGSIPVLST